MENIIKNKKKTFFEAKLYAEYEKNVGDLHISKRKARWPKPAPRARSNFYFWYKCGSNGYKVKNRARSASVMMRMCSSGPIEP